MQQYQLVYTDLSFETYAERTHGNLGYNLHCEICYFHADKNLWIVEKVFSGLPAEAISGLAGS